MPQAGTSATAPQAECRRRHQLGSSAVEVESWKVTAWPLIVRRWTDWINRHPWKLSCFRPTDLATVVADRDRFVKRSQHVRQAC